MKRGVISPVAWADMLVLDGDPVSDIGVPPANGERLDIIMRGGALVKNGLGA